MKRMRGRNMRYLVGLGVATAVSLGLLVTTWLVNGELLYDYLVWNLFLAWLPFLLANWLQRALSTRLWSSWPPLLLTVAWLAFLPNSFYMVSDFVHLSGVAADQILLSAVTFTCFIVTGLWLGMSSLYIVHRELVERVGRQWALVGVEALLFVASLAIYVGRDLRWNSWDVLVNPFGLLFDLSERLVHPAQYGAIATVVLPFFALLSVIYLLVWQTAQTLRTLSVLTDGPQ